MYTLDIDKKRDFLFSIRPVYAEKIVEGEKKVELRRKFIQSVMPGTYALIYCTSPVKAIIGTAEISSVARLSKAIIWRDYRDTACIARKDFDAYFDGVGDGYVIAFKNTRRLARSVHLADLKKRFGFMPPQSYRYVPEELHPLLHNEHVQSTHRH